MFSIIANLLIKYRDSIFVPIIALILSSAAYQIIFGNPELINKDKLTLLSLGLLAMMVFVFMVRFLSSNTLSSPSRTLERYAITELSKRVKELQNQRDILSKEKREEIIKELTEKLKSDATNDILTELKKEIRSNEYRIKLAENSKTTLKRIYSEIDALGRRGAINLALGVITAFSGIVTLSLFVIGDSQPHSSITDFTISFLPRLSIVMIIEVFSYFFLRLYKSSLNEIKYFQNEATNIEFNFVALETALHLNNNELINNSMSKFINIERNPILNNSQTTREQMDDALTAQQFKLTPEHLAEILRIVSPNRGS